MKWFEKLKKLRGNKTVEEVTDAMNLNPNVYEAYERGERMPLEPVKKIIARYYRTKVTAIWDNYLR